MTSVESFDHPRNVPTIITIEGGAKSGKGTGALGICDEMRSDGRDVLVIDQGLKFRALALCAGALGIDFTDQHSIDQYLASQDAKDNVLEVLCNDPREVKKLLDTSELSTSARMISPSPVAQELAIDLMTEQVASGQSADVIVLDGRDMQPKAEILQLESLGRYALGFYVTCDALVAARRVTKLFAPFDQLGPAEREALLKETESIFARNASDYHRASHPITPPTELTTIDITRFDIESAPEGFMYGTDTTYSTKESDLITAMSALVWRKLDNQAVPVTHSKVQPAGLSEKLAFLDGNL